MQERTCPGLPAEWVNAWLAAIGIVSLVPGSRLRWSDEASPVAVISWPQDDELEELLAEELLTQADLDALPIARSLGELRRIDLTLSPADFSERAEEARASELGWALSSFYTDALIDKGEQRVDKGPFLPGMQSKVNTPHDRLTKIVAAMADSSIRDSLDGVAQRSQQNGLGFDLTRIGSLADDTDIWIDPVVELLAFSGLRLFPVRGNGANRVNQRGWSGNRTSVGGFEWPAWSEPLDVEAVDALLDLFWSGSRQPAVRSLITGVWGTVPFAGVGSADSRRGFGSKRVDRRGEC